MHGVSGFGGKKQKVKSKTVYKLDQGGTELNLLSMKDIASPMFREPVPQETLNLLKDIPVRENLSESNLIDVDILIGLDHYWDIVFPTCVVLDKSLVAYNSKFGWFICGNYTNKVKHW